MELTNHFFLQAKNRGYNQRLLGKVAFVYILVSDPVSHWKNQLEVDACVQKIKQGIGYADTGGKETACKSPD